jgi:hypothetical protein
VTPAATQTANDIAARVAILADAELARSAVRTLGARKVECSIVDESRALAELASGAVLGWSLGVAPDPARAARLAGACATAARAGRPLILLVPPAHAGAERDDAIDRAAALAHLSAAGAAIVGDPDVWIEAMVLVALFGPPRGSRTALITGEGTYLAAQAEAVAVEVETIGVRANELSSDPDAPTDVVLHDPGLAPARATQALPVPIVPRVELWDGKSPALFGVRAGFAAVLAVGRAAERAGIGLGPAPRDATRELAIDHERLSRQLGKIGAWDRRIGDHETKVLLAAYGIPITRQAVATTPSAAIRLARKAGFPVEIKPWGPDVATERAGCPVERGVATAADVRRAVSAVLVDLDGAVIVRETPPVGREVSATFVRRGPLGWTAILDAPGSAAPAAAPVPLRLADAMTLAHHLASTRYGDPEPDRVGLADLLRRASHLVADHEDRFERLELGRIIVGGTRTLVVDAAIDLVRANRARDP